MFKYGRHLVTVVLFCLVAVLSLPDAALAREGERPHTDVSILTTTDMHGKCWGTDVLTDAEVTHTMLRVSSAVSLERARYGSENVVVIDNGDLFQGTPVSELSLERFGSHESGEPPAMARCLSEIGYDAFVLGNHEFDFAWDTMSATYRWLSDNGVAVLAANVCYDGSDGLHAAGESAFDPYLVTSITVGGHEHKIGILGLENVDVTRWDQPSNFAGLRFTHPGNDSFDISLEAEPYLRQMRDAGCEFIVCCYHAGVGTTEGELVFGANTDDQGLRLVQGTSGIDMLVLGHDHTSKYSNTFMTNREGRDILVVNGGGQELTHSVFRFSEDATGALAWELVESDNYDLGDFDEDGALAQVVKPYAVAADEYVRTPVGTMVGSWDANDMLYTSQTDTTDLVGAALLDASSDRMREAFEDGAYPTRDGVAIDHLDVDVSLGSMSAADDYTVSPGTFTVRDAHRSYRFANDIFVLALTGQEIREVLEENAATRLAARDLGDDVFFYSVGDTNTNIICAGLDFTYDLARPVGERVQIRGLSNGREFAEDGLYLVVINSYLLGNEKCGLRDLTERDVLLNLTGDAVSVYDLICEYVSDRTAQEGGVDPEDFTWHWGLTYSGSEPAFEGEVGATYAPVPEEGHAYVIFNDAECRAMGVAKGPGSFASVPCEVHGKAVAGPLASDVQVVFVHNVRDSLVQITDAAGRRLVCESEGGLSWTGDADAEAFDLWRLEETRGGWYLVNDGTGKAIEEYDDVFDGFELQRNGHYVHNFYEVTGDADAFGGVSVSGDTHAVQSRVTGESREPSPYLVMTRG